MAADRRRPCDGVKSGDHLFLRDMPPATNRFGMAIIGWTEGSAHIGGR
jgi:hypothetical protein